MKKDLNETNRNWPIETVVGEIICISVTDDLLIRGEVFYLVE